MIKICLLNARWYRALFCRKMSTDGGSGSGADDPGFVQLDGAQEIGWWAGFTRQNAQRLGNSERRIGLYEFCSALGAVNDDGILDQDIATLRFKDGNADPTALARCGRCFSSSSTFACCCPIADIKRRLLQLPPADTLRSNLCRDLSDFVEGFASASLQHTFNSSSSLALDSFARTSKPCRIFAMSAHALHGHERNATSVALCSDGERLVSGSLDKTARVWSVSRQELLRTFSGHTGEVYCVAVSPDGSWAVSGSADTTVCIWMIDTGDERPKLRGHTSAIWGVAASPNGQLVASASGDKLIKLWNPSNSALVRSLQGHGESVYSVAFTSNSETLVSASKDNTLKVWSVGTGNCTRTVNANVNNVKSLTLVHQDQYAVLGTCDKTIKQCELRNSRVEEPVAAHDDEVSCVAAFPVGQKRVASSSHDATVRISNLQTCETELTLKGNDDFMWSVAVSRDGRTLVSGCKSGIIKMWSLKFALE